MDVINELKARYAGKVMINNLPLYADVDIVEKCESSSGINIFEFINQTSAVEEKYPDVTAHVSLPTFHIEVTFTGCNYITLTKGGIDFDGYEREGGSVNFPSFSRITIDFDAEKTNRDIYIKVT